LPHGLSRRKAPQTGPLEDRFGVTIPKRHIRTMSQFAFQVQ
jgi:hypothetical protein